MDAITALVDRSAAPAAVATAFAQLRDNAVDAYERITSDAASLEMFVAVVAASRFLTRQLLADDGSLGVLRDLDTPVAFDGDLVAWKHRELLRIAARDLIGLNGLEQVGRELAQLADGVLEQAAVDVTDVAVIAMGKLGGRELNYASDIDVLFVGDGDARHVIDTARTCFRVDADLRPEGRAGPLVRTLESYEAYWDRWAQPWEFQALLKARPAAGNAGLGAAFAGSAAQHLWHRTFGADELRSLRDMKARAEELLSRKGLSTRELKRGRGGIRDVEFAVQLLQLVHGGADAALRGTNTLEALAELARAGYVATADADDLADAYRFLRTVEHRLQLVDEQQVHSIPEQRDALDHLARVLGYRDNTQSTAIEQFDADLRSHQSTVRAIHERLYFRPLLESFGGRSTSMRASGTTMPESAVGQRLAAFGFADADRTRTALRELTAGLTRSSRLMQQLLPLLLEWLADAPDPDLGLLGLRTLVSGAHRATQLVATFRDSPEAARRLCTLLGTGRLFLDGFTTNPELIADLAGASPLATPTSGAVRPLLRYKRAEELRIAARDVLGLDGVEATGASLTALAQTVLADALVELAPSVPFAVIAMGRFGGAELSYASDLDVLLVYDGSSPAEAAAGESVAEALMRRVKGATPATRLYVLDADLRPEGKQGPLARSLDAYRAYYERYAQTWERQALLRARFVAGDADLGRRFAAIVDDFLWTRPFGADEERDIRRMKARIERERIPPGDDPQFHLKLGPGSLSDVEWTAQLLQLHHHVPSTATMGALAALVDAGALEADDAAVLANAYRFCERTRNRWFLVKGAPGDSLPTATDQLSKLARSLVVTSAELREEYRRVTRRARAVVEPLFYGG